MSPLPSQPLISNGPATYLHYLTGRRNLLSLHMTLNLVPRHNFIQLVQDLVMGIVDPVSQAIEDEIVLDFTLGEGGKGQTGEGPGVWAVVDKSGVLSSIRKKRWDIVRRPLSCNCHLADPLSCTDIHKDLRELGYPQYTHGLGRDPRFIGLRPQCRQHRSR
jgi:hypothetical protein